MQSSAIAASNILKEWVVVLLLVDVDVADIDICNNDDEPHSSGGLVLTVLCSHSLQSPLNINPCRLTASAI